MVLSADQDPFFNTHMYSSFGELGVAVKTIMEEYQGERKMHDNITSIDDMQRFVENFPELRKKSHTVGKHVALMTQLVQQVDSTGTRVMGERRGTSSTWLTPCAQPKWRCRRWSKT